MDFQDKKILVVVAHPDDELLGLGGCINKMVTDHNSTVHVVVLGEGLTSRADVRNSEDWRKELKQHKANIEAAKDKLGYQSLSVYDFPDNRFDTIPLLDIVKVIEKEKNKFSPDIIFTHHGGDLNIDHQRTFEAVMTASRPLPGEHLQTIISFETPSGTEWQASTHPMPFLPNLFISINESNLTAKIDAMECYKFEKRTYPHPRSPEALRITTQKWGVSIGKTLAEAFCVVRDIS
jgi:LmbE family N-acetylglucosaminyl deacetylase